MRKKILFFPSSWSNGLVFQPQVTALSPHYDIEVIDTASFDTITQIVQYVIHHYKNIDCLIGLSLGGFAVLELIADYPTFVNQAVLIGTQAHELDKDNKQFCSHTIQEVEQGKLPELCSSFYNAVTGKTSKNNQTLMDIITKMPLMVGEQGCINHFKASITYQDQTHKLANIRAKTLILCGEEDQCTPISFHTTLANNIRNATLITVPDAGHFVTLEQPETVNQHLLKWLTPH